MAQFQGLFCDGKNAVQVPILNHDNIQYELDRMKPTWAIITEVATGNIIQHYKNENLEKSEVVSAKTESFESRYKKTIESITQKHQLKDDENILSYDPAHKEWYFQAVNSSICPLGEVSGLIDITAKTPDELFSKIENELIKLKSTKIKTEA